MKRDRCSDRISVFLCRQIDFWGKVCYNLRKKRSGYIGGTTNKREIGEVMDKENYKVLMIDDDEMIATATSEYFNMFGVKTAYVTTYGGGVFQE